MNSEDHESRDHRDVDTIVKLIASAVVSTMGLAMMTEVESALLRLEIDDAASNHAVFEGAGTLHELELSEAKWRRDRLDEAWRNHARAEGAPLGHDRASA